MKHINLNSSKARRIAAMLQDGYSNDEITDTVHCRLRDVGYVSRNMVWDASPRDCYGDRMSDLI